MKEQSKPSETAMIPAGYLLKRTECPTGFGMPSASHIDEVCSVSDCVNDNVINVVSHWRYNQFGFANSPECLLEIARSEGADLSQAQLFYYAIYPQQYPCFGLPLEPASWEPFTDAGYVPVETSVAPPPCSEQIELLGYDAVAYDELPNHSPLSCNAIASEVKVNRHCLFDEFDQAKAAIEAGRFEGGEEGDYRIVAVYRVESVFC